MKVVYTDKEKEALIDTMLAMIKGNLMKCDINDIVIEKERKLEGLKRHNGDLLAQKETGEYTYRINFKYKNGGSNN